MNQVAAICFLFFCTDVAPAQPGASSHKVTATSYFGDGTTPVERAVEGENGTPTQAEQEAANAAAEADGANSAP